MRVVLLIIISCWIQVGFSQDTLIYRSGKIEAVKIIAIEEDQGLVKYRSGNDTIIRSLSSLSDYKLHSTDLEDQVLQPNSATDLMPTTYTTISRRKVGNLFRIPSKYTYSGFSFGIDPTTFFMSQAKGKLIATNDHLSMYAEYKFRERIGLRLAGRIGLTKPDLNEVWGHEHTPGYAPMSEMIFEIGLEPTVYINKHNKLCFYIKPGAHFGKNHDVQYNSYRDYYNGASYGPDGFIYRSTSKIGEAGSYYRISLSPGWEINLIRHISFGLEAGLYFGNNMRTHRVTYYNTKESEEYIWQEERYTSDNRLFWQGAVNLIYRFGEIKEK